MSINYLDTVTMYYSCCSDIRNLFMTHWIWDNNNKDINLHCFCIKTDNAFIRFFPSMYGYRRLYMTFSLPKLYHNSKRNTYNVTDYDNATFMNIVETICKYKNIEMKELSKNTLINSFYQIFEY